MKLPRRTFLLQLAGAAAISISEPASGLDYPVMPVRMVVGFAAGGPTDIVGRLIGQSLSERLGQQFIIENRPAASSNIATEAVVNAAPDGYTLLVATVANAINATLYEKLNFDFIHDIAPVAMIMRYPNVMVVNPSFPAKTVPAFITYAKANPGMINMGSGGAGTSLHVAGELFKMMTGINMVHVPYRGAAPAVTDLIGGQVEVVFADMPSSIEHIRAGELRALAVTTARRSAALPNIPVVGDFLPGYETSGWNGLGAPRTTPPEIVNKLNRAVNAILIDPRMKARFAELGGMVLSGSPAEFGQLIAEETQKWAKVVKFSGAKAD